MTIIVTDRGPDRSVPETFAGKLEPNYYCRAWNPRRLKYCRAHAGAGTNHPGVGRCRHHDGGGDQKLRHGRDRRHRNITPARPLTLFGALPPRTRGAFSLALRNLIGAAGLEDAAAAEQLHRRILALRVVSLDERFAPPDPAGDGPASRNGDR